MSRSYISKKSAHSYECTWPSPAACIVWTRDNWRPCWYMWKKIYYDNFSRLPLINISVYISVKCMIYHFLHRTLHKVKNTHRFSLCIKAWISWSRKRSLKQQLIQPISGIVSSIMIWLYIHSLPILLGTSLQSNAIQYNGSAINYIFTRL